MSAFVPLVADGLHRGRRSRQTGLNITSTNDLKDAAAKLDAAAITPNVTPLKRNAR